MGGRWKMKTDSLWFLWPKSKRGACGVGKTRLHKKHPFNRCCEVHDQHYNELDWSDPNVSTEAIDAAFISAIYQVAGDDEGLLRQVEFIKGIVRKWGRARCWLARRFGIKPKTAKKV